MPLEDFDRLKHILSTSDEDYFQNKYNCYLQYIIPGVQSQIAPETSIDIFPIVEIKSQSLGFAETKNKRMLF